MRGALGEVLIWSLCMAGLVLGACQCAEMTRTASSFGLGAGESTNLMPDERQLVGGWVIYGGGCQLAHVEMPGIGKWYISNYLPSIEYPDLSSSLNYKFHTYQYYQISSDRRCRGNTQVSFGSWGCCCPLLDLKNQTLCLMVRRCRSMFSRTRNCETANNDE